jgi:hypothetical protein
LVGSNYTGLSITLTNLTTDVVTIAQSLSGFAFSFADGTYLSTLDSVVSPSFYLCQGSPGGQNPGACATYGPALSEVSPYGWAIIDQDPNLFAAGAGSLKPWAIVNGSVVGPVEDGLGNPPHNPWLGGAVVFNFTLSQGLSALPDITFARMYWGTGGNYTEDGSIDGTIDGAVGSPEPGSLLLFGTALAFVASRLRRRATK